MVITFIILTAIAMLLLSLSTAAFGKNCSKELKEATKDMKSAAVEFNRATRKAAAEFCNEIKRSLKR